MILKTNREKQERNTYKIIALFSTIGLVSLLYLNFYQGRFVNVVNLQPSGKYSEAVTVRLINPVVLTQIKYTLNGREPMVESDTYVKPILIKQSSTMKYAVFRGKTQLSDTKSRTYLIKELSDLPVISLEVNYRGFFDPAGGIYTQAYATKKGPEFWKQAYMEMYEVTGKKVLSQGIDVRIYGNKTRRSAQKSLKICASKEEDFNYRIFSNSDQNSFKCLLLRNSGNDWDKTMLRDGYMQMLVRDYSTLNTQNYRPAILFINGEYWGIHNIRESFDSFYFRDKYSIRARDAVVLLPNRANKGYPNVEEGKPGDEEKYNILLKTLKEDTSEPAMYAVIKQQMDVENYIDYMVFETFFNNNDWIDSNIKIWYYKGLDIESRENPYLDGKLRWLIYDLDSGFAESDESPYRKNQIEMANLKEDPYNKSQWQYIIFYKLLKNEEFRAQFIARYRELLDTAFTPENLNSRINVFHDAIEKEMPRHIARWKWGVNAWGVKYMQSAEDWENHIQRMRVFADERAFYVKQHLDDLESSQ